MATHPMEAINPTDQPDPQLPEIPKDNLTTVKPKRDPTGIKNPEIIDTNYIYIDI